MKARSIRPARLRRGVAVTVAALVLAAGLSLAPPTSTPAAAESPYSRYEQCVRDVEGLTSNPVDRANGRIYCAAREGLWNLVWVLQKALEAMPR